MSQIAFRYDWWSSCSFHLDHKLNGHWQRIPYKLWCYGKLLLPIRNMPENCEKHHMRHWMIHKFLLENQWKRQEFHKTRCGAWTLLTLAPSLSIDENPGALGMCIAIFKSFRWSRFVRKCSRKLNLNDGWRRAMTKIDGASSNFIFVNKPSWKLFFVI